MSLAATSMRGACLNARFAVNGIQNESRLVSRAVMGKPLLGSDLRAPAPRSLQCAACYHLRAMTRHTQVTGCAVFRHCTCWIVAALLLCAVPAKADDVLHVGS